VATLQVVSIADTTRLIRLHFCVMLPIRHWTVRMKPTELVMKEVLDDECRGHYHLSSHKRHINLSLADRLHAATV